MTGSRDVDDWPVDGGMQSRGGTGHRRVKAGRIGVAALVVAVAFASGAVLVSAGTARSWFPNRWDPRIAPIAAEVARLRGLDFEHPVPIRYLMPQAFEKQLGADQPDVSDRADAQRQEGVFRALGFIGGRVDLLQSEEASQSSGTLAFYDVDAKRIFVRGTTLDVEHRVTIAHELTHVLQDQHFNLLKLQKRAVASDSGDAASFKALVEGDAVRIQEAYLAHLSQADRAEYDREDKAEGERIGKETASVPEIVDVLTSAPYSLGPLSVRVIFDTGGNAAVNKALTGAVPSSAVFVDAGDVTPATPVADPAPPPGGVRLGRPEAFGPFELYLTLSARIDPERALEAADAVDGGRATTFRSNGTICYKASVDPRSQPAKEFVRQAVRAWARGRSRTTVDDSGDLVSFTACDPGRAAPNPSSRGMQRAIQLLGLRTGITLAAAQDGRDAEFARCVGRVFLETPGAATLALRVGNAQPTAAQETQLRSAAARSGEACRDDSDSGLR